MEKPKVILFDWDNTLVGTESVIRCALNQTLEAFGKIHWSDEEFSLSPHLSLKDSFPLIFNHEWTKARDFFHSRYRAIHLRYLAPLLGVVELLDVIAHKKIPVGVVSNKTGLILREEIDHLAWSERFFSIIGSGDAAFDKPSCAPVRQALGKNYNHENVWVVGDSCVYLECARRAGCYPIIIKTGPKTPVLEENEKGKIVDNCLQLKIFLSQQSF